MFIKLLLTLIISLVSCSENTHLTAENKFNKVGDADLTVEKLADLPGGANEGSTITYIINVINTGPVVAQNVKIIDQCPAGTTATNSYTLSQGSFDGSSWNIGQLDLNSPVSLEFACLINAGTGGTDIVNEITESEILMDQNDPNNDNNRPSVTTVITGAADLEVSKVSSAGVNNVDEGSEITYTINLMNNGPSLATGVSVLDSCPEGTTQSTSSLPVASGSTSFDGSTWMIGDVSDGGSESLSFTCVVDAGMGGRSITNSISSDDVGANQPDPNNTNNQSSVSNSVNNIADLTLSKSSSVASSPVSEGENITYTIGVSNAGAARATFLSIAESCPAGSTFQPGLVAASHGTYNGLTWGIGSLDAGANASLSFACKVNVGQSGGTLTNTISPTDIIMNQTDPNPADNTASDSQTVANEADLSVSKVASSASPSEGDTINYTVTVTNNGAAQATGLSLNDACPSPQTIFSSAIATLGSYSSGVWTIGSLNSGATTSLTLSCIVAAGTSGDSISNSITPADISMDQTDPNSADNAASASSTVQNSADLVVGKQVSPVSPQDEGDILTYAISITNNGAAQATNLNLADACPSGTTSTGASSASQGSYGGGIWSVGALNRSASATLSFDCSIDAGQSGELITNSIAAGDITMDQTDPNTANSTPSVTSTVKNETDIEVLKSVSPAGVLNEGDTLVYTITLNNLGPAQATNLNLNDQCPSGTSATASTPSTSSGTYTAGVWSVPSINNSGSETLSFECSVDSGQGGGSVSNSISPSDLTMDQVDSSAGNNSATASSEISPDSDLNISKMTSPIGAVDEGDDITYTITASNDAGALITNLVITDPCPVNTTYKSSTLSGSTTYNSGSGDWSVSSLSVGTSETLELVCTVDAGAGGQTIENSIDAGDVSLDQNSVGSTTPSVTNPVNNSTDLVVTKSASPSSGVDEGEIIAYSVSVTNSGPATATNLSIADSCPAGTSFVSVTPTIGSYSSGNWSIGSLGVGVNQSLTLNCRVDVGSGGTSISNSITAGDITMDQAELDTSNNTPTATSGIDNQSDIEVSKSVSPTGSIDEGGTLTFTITVENNGPNRATSLNVTDSCPTGTTATGTPSASVGSFSGSSWGIGNLDESTSATLNFDCLVNAGTGSTTISNTISSGDISMDQTDPNTSNDGASTATPVNNNADLRVNKVSSPIGNVDEGDTITYTITVENLGAAQASNVVLTDSCPSGSTASGTPSASQGTYAASSWNIGTLNVGVAFTATLSFDCQVDVGSGGSDIVNSISPTDVNMDQIDPNAGNGTPSTTNPVNAAIDLINPGPVGITSPTTLSGSCSPDGDPVFVDIADASPNRIGPCLCSSGSFTCPPTTFSELPPSPSFVASNSGSIDTENTTTTPSVDLTNPGPLETGLPTVLTGACAADGDPVTINIADATPSSIGSCPCVGGTFTCPSVTFTELPINPELIASNSGASDTENTTTTPKVDLTNPGPMAVGSAEVLEGTCSPDGDPVTVNIAGATPSSVGPCPCDGGTFTCPSTIFTALPTEPELVANNSGASDTETTVTAVAVDLEWAGPYPVDSSVNLSDITGTCAPTTSALATSTDGIELSHPDMTPSPIFCRCNNGLDATSCRGTDGNTVSTVTFSNTTNPAVTVRISYNGQTGTDPSPPTPVITPIVELDVFGNGFAIPKDGFFRLTGTCKNVGDVITAADPGPAGLFTWPASATDQSCLCTGAPGRFDCGQVIVADPSLGPANEMTVIITDADSDTDIEDQTVPVTQSRSCNVAGSVLAQYIPPIWEGDTSRFNDSMTFTLTTESADLVTYSVEKPNGKVLFRGTLDRNNPVSVTPPAGTPNNIPFFETNRYAEVMNDEGFILRSNRPVSLLVHHDNQYNKYTLSAKGPCGAPGRLFFPGSATRGTNPWGGTNNRAHFVSFMAMEDATAVTVTPRNPVIGPSGVTSAPFVINLDKGQSYMIVNGATGTTTSHIVGMKIESDKDITVNSGANLVAHRTSSGQIRAGDAGVDMIAPVNTLGQEYVLITSDMISTSEYGVAVATEDTTEIFRDGVSLGIFMEGDHVEIDKGLVQGEPVLVESDKVIALYDVVGLSPTASEFGMTQSSPVLSNPGSGIKSFARATGTNKLALYTETSAINDVLFNGVAATTLANSTFTVGNFTVLWLSDASDIQAGTNTIEINNSIPVNGLLISGTSGGGKGSYVTDAFGTFQVQTVPVVAHDNYYTTTTNLTIIENDSVLNLLGNDFQVNSQPLSVNETPVTPPANGTVILDDDGTFVYVPNTGFNGTDSFVYEATDGTNTGTATVHITVDP